MAHLRWLGISLLFIPFLVQSQECNLTLQGRILDEHDQTPLPFTTVFLVETGKGTLVDEEGLFSLDGLCPGTYTLMASHVGCEPERIQFQLRQDTVINIFLEHHVELLDAIVKTAHRIEETSSQTRTELSGEELQRLQGRSLAQMLSSMSGVTMIQTGPGIQKPVIHGLYGSRILIVQHEVRQEGQQWGMDHAPEIDPTIAGKLTVIKGAEGVRYGPDALGGVILITPEPLPRTKGFGGAVFSELQSNGRGGKLAGNLQGGLAKPGWGWRATGSYKLLGDRAAPDYLLNNTGSQEIGGSAQFGYTGNRHTFDLYYSLYKGRFGILRAAHIGNLTDLELAINADEPWYQRPFHYEQINPRQEVIHHLIRVEASRQVSHMWNVLSRYSFQWDDRQEFDIRRGDKDKRPALDLRILSNQWDLIAEHRPWKHWKGSFGITGQHQTNFNMPGTGTRPLIPNYITLTGSVYAIERYLRDQWEWEGGLRYDFRYLDVSRVNANGQLEEPNFHFHNLNFSTGGRYRFSSAWSVLLNAGTAFRAPGVNELFSQGLHHASAAIEEGNENLEVEKAFKTVGTLRYEQEKLDVELAGYGQWINGFINLRPEGTYVLTIRGAFPVFKYVQTDARLLGADVSLRYAIIPSLTWTGQASLLWATDLRSDAYLFGMPPIQFRQELQYRFTSKRTSSVYEFGVAARHILRQDRAAQQDFAPAPQGYTILSATAMAEWGKTRWILGAENVLNSVYRDYLDRLRYFADGPGRNVYIKMHIPF